MFPLIFISPSAACPPHPPSPSGCLIKGALSNEITPLGLIAWLIDRHTAGRGLRPSKSPVVFFFFFFSRLIEITGLDRNILVTSFLALLLLLYWTCFCIHTTGVKGRIHECKKHIKKNHYNSHSKAVHLKKAFHSTSVIHLLVQGDTVFCVTSFIILILVNPCGREGRRPPLPDTASSITQYFKTSDTSIWPL